MSDVHAQQLPAPDPQATVPASYPLNGSLTAGLEYTFTSAAGYAITAVYQQTLLDGCLKVLTRDGIDGFINPTTLTAVVLARVSARAE